MSLSTDTNTLPPFGVWLATEGGICLARAKVDSLMLAPAPDNGRVLRLAHEGHEACLVLSAELCAHLARLLVAPRTPSTIRFAIGNDEPASMGWEEFARINSDGLSPEELQDIAATVLRGETYRGGGGAAVGFTVELVEA